MIEIKEQNSDTKTRSNDIASIDLRTTMILRPEEGIWKIVHLHGDPITTPESPESVIHK